MELVSSSLPNLGSSFLVSLHPHRLIFHHPILLLTPSLCLVESLFLSFTLTLKKGKKLTGMLFFPGVVKLTELNL